MEIKVLKHPFEIGNNSDRALVEINNKKYLIKITDTKELTPPLLYSPKLISCNSMDLMFLNKEGCDYVYQYEYIEGTKLSDVKINDDSFVKLIAMFEYFTSINYYVWDPHLGNIIINNKNLYFVDMGGFSKIEDCNNLCVFSIEVKDFPEEYNDPVERMKPLNTLPFLIYRVANLLLSHPDSNFSKPILKILTKMHSYKICERYQTFAEIMTDIKLLNL